jgi:hypothetical protein
VIATEPRQLQIQNCFNCRHHTPGFPCLERCANRDKWAPKAQAIRPEPDTKALECIRDTAESVNTTLETLRKAGTIDVMADAALCVALARLYDEIDGQIKAVREGI